MSCKSLSLIATATLVALFFGCAKQEQQKAPPDYDRVTIFVKDKPPLEVKVELALTEAQREKGLMFREHLDPDAGMLFIFREDAQQWFWMRNTLIELDMIFIKSDMTVLGCVQKAPPKTETPRGVLGPSRYVLEVVGGYCENHGIVPGTRVDFTLPSIKAGRLPPDN